MKLKTILIAAAVAAALALPASAQEKILIGSTSASSSHYGYFVAVGKLINEHVKGVTSSVVETGATVDNLRRIQRGQVDIGLVTTNVVQHAFAGSGKFKDKPVKTRLLWVYSDAPQNVVVRADSGVTALAGLAGKRFNPGIKGSATESTAEAVLAKLGIKPELVRGSTTDVVDMIKDNRIIGYVKSGAGKKLDSSTLDIATFTKINVLGLTEAQKAVLAKEMPDISVVDIPAGAGNGLPAYSTWSFGVGAAARMDLPDEVAYGIVKAVMEDKTAQGNALAAVKGLDLAQMTLTYGTIPLHPGAVKWFKEKGLTVPARLMP